MTDTYHRNDCEAMDRLAEFFKLPEWRIGDSVVTFVECIGEVVASRRKLDGAPSAEFLAEFGLDDSDDETEDERDDDEYENAIRGGPGVPLENGDDYGA